jgi:hypothetical protein
LQKSNPAWFNSVFHKSSLILFLKDNEKRRALEARQAKAEKEKNNKKKRKDEVRTTLKFQEDECIVDKLLSEIRQGFPLKKRRRTSTDNTKDPSEDTSNQTTSEGIVLCLQNICLFLNNASG